jgi:hypothetical protein
LTIIVRPENGRSTAVNLTKHSWETEIVPGDESKIQMTLDDGRMFIIGLDKYEEIVSALEKAKDFMIL